MKTLRNLMTNAYCKVAAFAKDEKGASGIEYAIIATIAAIAIAVFASSSGIANAITDIFDKVEDAVQAGGSAAE